MKGIFIFTVLVVCFLGVNSSILNDLNVFTGPLFGNNFINDMNNPFLRELKASEMICMDELGCFSTMDEGFFHPQNRPINVLPFHRNKINVRFLLYTRMNPDQPFLLSYKNSFSLTKSTFNAGRKTKFIIHGLFDNIYLVDWMMKMKDAFLQRGDYNVIVVDWSCGNQFPYTQATANSRVVGAEIALLIRLLEKRMGITQESVHLIGHSLGSHIAGYAGERLEKLGRISGLDPAGPYFLNMPTKVRLDPSDALFVDVWHTDADTVLSLALGHTGNLGHVDFFPNDGKNQPGCGKTDPKRIEGNLINVDWLGMFSWGFIISGIRTLIVCNHDRAVKLFTDSINRKPGQCKPMAYACPDYSTFLSGKCADCGNDGKGCALMSYDMEDTGDRLLQRRIYTQYGGIVEGNHTVSLRYFVSTAASEPFCLYHYQVAIEFQGHTIEEGTLDVSVVTTDGDIINLGLRKGAETFVPGSTQLYLITSPVKLTPYNVVLASLSWTPAYQWSSIERRLHIGSIKIVPMEYSNRSAQSFNTIVFGGTGPAGHPPGQHLVVNKKTASY